ncbi:MAG: hypothetical protein IJ262_04225 [Clostridia bacterium]|nr:hypothetical protein [Clostridia bacterium]
MGFLKSKNTSGTPLENLEVRYNSSIVNLLLVVVFTAINVVLLVTNSNTYFLFSAFIPYFLADYGMYFCGMYPEEYYSDVPDMEFSQKSLFAITISIAVAILLLYFLCWYFSKKKKIGWLIFALVLFVVDTLAMLGFSGFSSDMILDIVFHVWVIASLVGGIVNFKKLKKLPEASAENSTEEEIKTEGETEASEYQNNFENQMNSDILRMADTDVKERKLLEAEKNGYRIVYRRVKKTNELVINGRVYDEYVALAEFPHVLKAVIDGHKIEVKYDSVGFMYIFFDGEELAKKLRLI